jgi:type IV pilus assembly protein PilW
VNASTTLRRLALPTRRRMRGFTLIELMIAMILGLIVIAGVTSVFLAGQRSFRTNNALSEVQDNSRVAFELLARDIREAGLTGCANQGDMVNVLNNESTAWWANWANVVHGYDTGQDDPAVTTGTAVGQRVAGTPSVELIGAANANYTVKDPGESSAYTITLNEAGADLQSGDIVLLCDPGQSAILQIHTWTPGTSTFDYIASGSTTGNSSTILDYTGPGVPTAQPFPANSQVASYNAVDWYIGYNLAGTKSLYRVSLQNVGGVPKPTAQEMVRNVTTMQLTYLNPTVNSDFVDASHITDWTGVTAVRAVVTVDSTFQRATTDTNTQALSRQYAFTTTLRNRVD